jgi:hypothetical protein
MSPRPINAGGRKRAVLMGGLAAAGLCLVALLLAVIGVHLGRNVIAVVVTIVGPATAAALMVAACAVVTPQYVPHVVEIGDHAPDPGEE